MPSRLEQRAVQRAPGLQIVIMQNDGSQRVAYQPPPMLDVIVPVPEPEPATRPDAEVEWVRRRKPFVNLWTSP